MTRRTTRSLPVVLAVIAALWIVHTLTQYFVRGIDRSRFWREKLAEGFEPWTGWQAVLLVHAGAACVAIAAGLFSFGFADRASWRLHRTSGITYMLAVLASAAAGLPLAFTATGGAASVAAFIVLNVAWVTTTLIAWRAARRREIVRHRVWIGRSFAITLANTTLHILTSSLDAAATDRGTAYVLAAWLCWPLNLAVYELARRVRHSRRKEHAHDPHRAADAHR